MAASGPLADCLLERNHRAYTDIDQLYNAMAPPDPNSETWPFNRWAVKRQHFARAADWQNHYVSSEERG